MRSIEHAKMLNCHRCEKILYEQDRLGPVNGHIYHRTCFKCHHCDTSLTLKSYKTSLASINDKEIYCSAHAPKAVGLSHVCLQSQRSFVNGVSSSSSSSNNTSSHKQSQQHDKVTSWKSKENLVANRAKLLQTSINFFDKSKQDSTTHIPKARIIRDTVGSINYKKYMEVIKRNNNDLKVSKLVDRVEKKNVECSQETPNKNENQLVNLLRNELNFYESFKEPIEQPPQDNSINSLSSHKSIESNEFESIESVSILNDGSGAGDSVSSSCLNDPLGRIMISYRYSNEIFVVTIHKAECLRSPNNEHLDTYVKVMLIPDANKISTCNTAIKKNTNDPVWTESFGYQISLDDVRLKYIHLCVKDHKMDQQLLSTGLHDEALKLLSLGEALIPLDDTQESMLYEIWYKLQEPSDVQALILNNNI